MTPRQQLAAAFKAAIFERIKWVPVSDAPEDGLVSVVKCPGRSAAGIFRNGAWVTAKGRPLPFEPTHYMVVTDGPA